MTKRALDLSVSAVALVLLAPVFVVVAVLVKLGSTGPVFFRQERIGRRFRPFLIYKFRTMTVAPAPARIALGDESRVTRLGRLLRQAKIDEWPQLFNVLRGDMSLVGPRPEVRQFVELFHDDYARILEMRPGMTDLASIKYRNETDLLKASNDPEAEYVRRILPDKIRLAREYQRRSSILFDLGVIARTAWHVVGVSPSASEEEGAPASSQSEGALADSLLMFPRELRRAMVVVVNLVLAMLSTYVAFSLRFDGVIPTQVVRMYLGTLPWLILARGSTFFLFRLNEGMWRYVGLWDLRRIAAAVAVSTAVFYLCVRYGYGTDDYPRAVFLIDAALLLIFMGAFRLSPRLYREVMRPPGKRRLLILGAGDMGERALRRLQHDPDSSYGPVGFVDDDLSKVGQRIHGVPVLGGVGDLPAIVAREKPQEITIAVANPRPGLVRELVTILEPYNVQLTKIVEGKENGKGGPAHVRNLSIEDLLSRPPVGLDVNQVRDLITGWRVLVTGAGGSIGSELCRQIAALHPASLVLFERYENGLYAIATGLHDSQHDGFVHPVVGDVTDAGRLDAVFREHRPDIVFHAAAHKHVPLMEGNPCEAVKNNVTGTRLVAEAAKRHGVDRFILISTDKAANPTSVMGASKRVAELLIRQMALRGATRFVTVRFGNVLGSNGSVLPRFQEQIKAGGPVTVTHPDVTRYFMLIPEAVQLVLHAAAVGQGGDTLVLDMGEQIRVLDLARNLIRLSGHTPDEDIPIVFTGMRPGEKLAEELAGDGEIVDAGPVDKIQRVVSHMPYGGTLEEDVRELEQAAAQGDGDAVIALLCRLVPAFHRSSSVLAV